MNQFTVKSILGLALLSTGAASLCSLAQAAAGQTAAQQLVARLALSMPRDGTIWPPPTGARCC